jgi:hypothetical protein
MSRNMFPVTTLAAVCGAGVTELRNLPRRAMKNRAVTLISFNKDDAS